MALHLWNLESRYNQSARLSLSTIKHCSHKTEYLLSYLTVSGRIFTEDRLTDCSALALLKNCRQDEEMLMSLDDFFNGFLERSRWTSVAVQPWVRAFSILNRANSPD